MIKDISSMTIGQRLRTAREARHMSIGDIARRTFIQTRFLQALEDDNLGLLPDTHRRLFIREYARMVGVDPDQLYPLLEDYVPPEPVVVVTETYAGGALSSGSSVAPIDALPEEDRRINSAFLRRLSAGRGVKLGGGGASGWLLRGALLLLILVGGYFLLQGISEPDDAPKTSDVMGTDSSDTGRAHVLPRADGDTTVAQTGEDIVLGDSLTLEGRATGRIWFAIVADGRKSEQGVMDSGMVKTWRAEKSFKISLTNAGGLTLLLNGKSLGTLGAQKTSVRNKIIDKDGLKTPLQTTRRTTQSSPTPRRTRTTATTPRRRTRPAPSITPTRPRGPVAPPSNP